MIYVKHAVAVVHEFEKQFLASKPHVLQISVAGASAASAWLF